MVLTTLKIQSPKRWSCLGNVPSSGAGWSPGGGGLGGVRDQHIGKSTAGVFSILPMPVYSQVLRLIYLLRLSALQNEF